MKAISNETLHALLAEIVKDINSKVSVENLDNLVTEYLKAHPQEETDITETVLKIINDNIDSFPTISNYNFKIGTVTTVNPSQDASVSIEKDDSKKEIIFNFEIPKGIVGANGKSAYEVAVENGFKGTVAEWLESLKGKDGKSGTGSGDSAFTPSVAQDILDLFIGAAYANAAMAEVVHKYAIDTRLVIPATGITLNQETIKVDNEPITLLASIVPSFSTEKITWSSSDSSIATVKDGVITPVGNGTITITATVGDYSASCEATVTKRS